MILRRCSLNKDLIINKIKKIKLFKMIDMFLRIVLTLFGTISLVSILMFLNSKFGISYFKCFIMILIVPSIYSFVVNSMLKRFGNAIKKMEFEVEDILNKVDKSNEISKDNKLELEIRFDKLSADSKLMLLRYVRDSLPRDLNNKIDINSSNNIFMSVLEMDNNFVIDRLDDEKKESTEIYTKSKKKRDL